MILLLHILIALGSVGFTTYLIIRPSVEKTRVAIGLVLATLFSGTLLVVSSHAAILSACISGLVYTTLVTAGILIAQRRLAAAKDQIKK